MNTEFEKWKSSEEFQQLSAADREAVEKLRKAIRRAMIYPFCVVCVGVLMIGAWIFYVIPEIEAIYSKASISFFG
jgi:type II secretory pathway component PulF